MNWINAPIGMIRHDELLNILNALKLTGGCDDRTLVIVAQAVGLEDYFKPELFIEIEQDAIKKSKYLPG